MQHGHLVPILIVTTLIMLSTLVIAFQKNGLVVVLHAYRINSAVTKGSLLVLDVMCFTTRPLRQQLASRNKEPT
ncbi:hypothetical protein QFZ84_000248 [Pseudomonas fluorescens]